jgi:hypothetical protein
MNWKDASAQLFSRASSAEQGHGGAPPEMRLEFYFRLNPNSHEYQIVTKLKAESDSISSLSDFLDYQEQLKRVYDRCQFNQVDFDAGFTPMVEMLFIQNFHRTPDYSDTESDEDRRIDPKTDQKIAQQIDQIFQLIANSGCPQFVLKNRLKLQLKDDKLEDTTRKFKAKYAKRIKNLELRQLVEGCRIVDDSYKRFDYQVTKLFDVVFPNGLSVVRYYDGDNEGEGETMLKFYFLEDSDYRPICSFGIGECGISTGDSDDDDDDDDDDDSSSSDNLKLMKKVYDRCQFKRVKFKREFVDMINQLFVYSYFY